MANDKRLAMLEQMTSSGQADSFAWYGLALEYAGRDRLEDALGAFKRLRKDDPDYLAMYLMCGTMLTKAGRMGEGREWLEVGILKATAKGDQHALAELHEALDQIPPPASRV